MTRNQDIDQILENTIPRPKSAKPPARPRGKPLGVSLRAWASSQVAAYRVGLVMGYVVMMYFGTSAFIAGIPVFEFTTPEGWTPVWAGAVTVGGLIAGIGAIKAGTEPLTREIRVFNRIELVGAILLFLTLFTYAFILLLIGYQYGDAGRASVGAGFVALGVHPTVRMLWLIFRPRFLALAIASNSGPIVIVPPGYALFLVDSDGRPLEAVARSHEYSPAGDDRK